MPWLYRECCDAIVEVSQKYGDLEFFACECGKKVMGEHIKTYYDTKEEAEKAKSAKLGGGMEVDLSEFM